MRVIAYKKFRDAGVTHPEVAAQLELLYRDLKSNKFDNLNQVKDHFPYVSILKNNRVVFNVGGNKFRVVVHFVFTHQIVYVLFADTHAEYDKIDANSV